MLVVERDGFGGHYTGMPLPTDGLVLDPRLEGFFGTLVSAEGIESAK